MTKLIRVIDEVVDLLSLCNRQENADWFKAKRKILLELNPQDDAFRRELIEIKGIIGGMGSFTDLPLYPRRGVKLTARDAGNRQWDLAEQLGQAIDELLSQQS